MRAGNGQERLTLRMVWDLEYACAARERLAQAARALDTDDVFGPLTAAALVVHAGIDLVVGAFYFVRNLTRNGASYYLLKERFPRLAPVLRRTYWRVRFTRWVYDGYAVEPRRTGLDGPSLSLVFGPLLDSARQIDQVIDAIVADRLDAIRRGQFDRWHWCGDPRPAAPMRKRLALLGRALWGSGRRLWQRGLTAVWVARANLALYRAHARTWWADRPRWGDIDRAIACWEAVKDPARWAYLDDQYRVTRELIDAELALQHPAPISSISTERWAS